MWDFRFGRFVNLFFGETSNCMSFFLLEESCDIAGMGYNVYFAWQYDIARCSRRSLAIQGLACLSAESRSVTFPRTALRVSQFGKF